MSRLRLGALLMVAVLVTGCALVPVFGSGKVVTRTESIEGFDSLIVEDGFHVKVSQGESYSVVICISEGLVKRLRVSKEGSALRIALAPGAMVNAEKVTLEVDVRMPELCSLGMSGGSHADLDHCAVKSLDATLSGGCHLSGEIETGDAMFGLTGGSHVTLSGTAGNVTVKAAGGSHAKLGSLKAHDAVVEATGGGHATVHPSGRLDVTAKGGSHVKYVGSPVLGTVASDGSSSIRKR